jgi:hypothetical protein
MMNWKECGRKRSWPNFNVKFRVFWDVYRAVKYMLTDVSEVRTASIIRAMMETVHTSETSVNIYLTTRQYIPEDCKLHTRRRENLKSHIILTCYPSIWLEELREIKKKP